MTPSPVAPTTPSGSRLLLFGLLALGFGLRVWGLGFGLPLELRPDEAYYRNAVAGMIASGDLDPKLYAYPGLPLHALLGVQAGTHALARRVGADVPAELEDFARDVTLATWIQRWLSCLFGVGTIFLVHRLARRLAGEAAGLIAAGFLAVAHLPVREAHFGVVDTPATFFIVLALLAVLRAIERGRLRDFVLAGVAAGLATAMRYTPALLAVSLVIAAFTRAGRDPEQPLVSTSSHRVGTAALAMIATFLATCPYTLLAWDAFRAEFDLQAKVSTGAGRGMSLDAMHKHLALSLGEGLGWPLLALAGLGFVVALIRPRLGGLAVVIYGLAHFTLLSLSEMDFVRYALPLAPIVAVLAAVGLATSFRPETPRRFAFAMLAAFVLAAPTLWRSVQHDLLLARETTFETTKAWVEDERAPDDRLVFTSPWFQRKLGFADRTVSYDPETILYGEAPTWIVVASHPHPHWEAPEGVDLLLADGGAEVVARFDGFDPETPNDTARFDDKDSFYYPFAGFGAVQRGGPDVVIHRITPGPRPTTPPPPPAPPLQVIGGSFRDQLAIGWTTAPDAPVLAWALRYATKEELEAERIPAPRFVPPGLRRYVFEGIAPGTYWVAASAIGPGGVEGPMQSFGPIKVVAPPR